MQTDGTMLITNNIDACIPFYSALLDASAELGAGWAQFTLSDGTIVALHTPWEEGMTTHGGSHVLLLRVDSLTEQAVRLGHAGLDVSEPHEIPGGAVVGLTDPDGRTVQLIERSQTST
ncbi:MAG: VOC family protein [Actinobacteria bacterium]|nr:VOC family protein [Actinomycetota bacterium]